MPAFIRYEEEKYFVNPNENNKKAAFPSIADEPTVYLSVIVPSKDEEERLPIMLDECLEYLEKRRQRQSLFTYEVIVVDDGSNDRTSEVALKYSKKYTSERVRVLTLAHNRGKGGAVRLGFWVARGRYLLFADADAATRFEDFEKLESQIMKMNRNGKKSKRPKQPNDDEDDEDDRSDLAMVVGSRAHLEKDSIAHRSFFRTILMYGFHFLVWLLCVRTVKDTQCGFKLFTRRTARLLFSNMHVERWAFDVELLFIAEHLRIPIGEISVLWHEVEGSKLTPWKASLQMARDLFLIWFRYFFGIWTIETEVKTD